MRMTHRILSVLAVLWLLVGPVLAEPQERLSVDYIQFTLPNGLNVILHEDHTVPVVHTNLWYLVGSANEKPGRTGFAHLFEHLMFEGSGHVREGEFDTLLEGVGGNNNASTSQDRTNYYISLPSNALELALFLESDRMGHLLKSVSPDIVDGQRDVVKNEMRQSYLNRPYGKVWLELPGLLYPESHPYSWPVIGSMEDISAAGFKDVTDFFRTYYVPNNASLVVAGDIDPVRTRALVEKWFSDVQSGAPVAPVSAPPVRLEEVRRKTLTDRVELPLGLLVWHTPAILTPGDAEMDLVASVLCGSKNSRLYRRLVHELQIAQQVSASQLSQRLGSLFVIQFIPRPGHTLDEVQRVIDEELALLHQEPPKRQEIDRALNGLEAAHLQAIERASSKADQLNAYYMYTGNPDYFEEDLARYRAISPEDLRSVVRRFLPADRRVELYVIPEQEATR
jgi:zinc protease